MLMTISRIFYGMAKHVVINFSRILSNYVNFNISIRFLKDIYLIFQFMFDLISTVPPPARDSAGCPVASADRRKRQDALLRPAR